MKSYCKNFSRTFLLLIFLFTLIPAQLYASYELSIDAIGLSYPSGSSFKADFGYTKILYVQQTKLLRGYIRPHAFYKTSIFLNSVAIGASFSPILPLEFSYTKEYQKRAYDKMEAFDCAQVSCTVNQIQREHFGVNIALAYQKFFYLSRNNWQNISLDSSNNPFFAEETSSILGLGLEDQLYQHTSLLAYKINDKDFLGLFMLHSKMKKTQESSTIKLITYGSKFKKMFLMGGLGGMSRYNTTHLTAVITARWSIRNGVFPFH